jgi:predicted dehydrogenase
VAVAAASGASALGTARRFAFRRATTDADEAISGSDVSAVVIATRHDLHADLAVKALHAGRGVYVEKPLALTREQLLSVCGAWSASDAILSVGFNRRFAPTIRRLRSLCSGSGPLTISYIVNVERPPAGSWILDPVQGGGVALSEGGHFLDTLSFLVGEQPRLIAATRQDECSYQATVDFRTAASPRSGTRRACADAGPKELITLAGRGVVAEFTDFRSARVWSDGKRSSWRSRTQDKGHSAALAAWVRGLSRARPRLVHADPRVVRSDALPTRRPPDRTTGPHRPRSVPRGARGAPWRWTMTRGSCCGVFPISAEPDPATCHPPDVRARAAALAREHRGSRHVLRLRPGPSTLAQSHAVDAPPARKRPIARRPAARGSFEWMGVSRGLRRAVAWDDPSVPQAVALSAPRLRRGVAARDRGTRAVRTDDRATVRTVDPGQPTPARRRMASVRGRRTAHQPPRNQGRVGSTPRRPATAAGETGALPVPRAGVRRRRESPDPSRPSR